MPILFHLVLSFLPDKTTFSYRPLFRGQANPDSFGGKEEWAEREEIAKSLSLEQLKRQWARIDKYIDQVRAGTIIVDDTPFGKGIYFPDKSAEATKASDKREEQHRKMMEYRGM